MLPTHIDQSTSRKLVWLHVLAPGTSLLPESHHLGTPLELVIPEHHLPWALGSLLLLQERTQNGQIHWGVVRTSASPSSKNADRTTPAGPSPCSPRTPQEAQTSCSASPDCCSCITHTSLIEAGPQFFSPTQTLPLGLWKEIVFFRQNTPPYRQPLLSTIHLPLGSEDPDYFALSQIESELTTSEKMS